MTDRSAGVLTTAKLQALLDCGISPGIRSRRELADALTAVGASISKHGVDAWFRRVDSNYFGERSSLTSQAPSYAIPAKRWPPLLMIFGIDPGVLDLSDTDFRKWCLAPVCDRNQAARVPVRPLAYLTVLKCRSLADA